MAARIEHNATEVDLKEQHKRCQAVASKLEGPVVPGIRREAEQIASAFKSSNIIGFTASG